MAEREPGDPGPAVQAGARRGKDSLFDLAGRIDDGPDLLAEPLSGDAARAWEELDALLARALDAMPYEGVTE